MAIERLDSQSASAGDIGSTGLTLTFPATATSGNLLIASVAWMNGAGDAGTTTTASISGWAEAVTQGRASPTFAEVNGVSIFYKISDGTETEVTPVLTNSRRHLVQFTEFSGIDGTPLDKTNSFEQPSDVTSIQPGSTGTLSQADELAICAVGWGNDQLSSPTWDSSFAETGAIVDQGGTGPDISLAHGYLIVSATTALNPQHSHSSNALDAIACIATFKAPSAGLTPEIDAATVIKAISNAQLANIRGIRASAIDTVISNADTLINKKLLAASTNIVISNADTLIARALNAFSPNTISVLSLLANLRGIIPSSVNISISNAELDITALVIVSLDGSTINVIGAGASLAVLRALDGFAANDIATNAFLAVLKGLDGDVLNTVQGQAWLAMARDIAAKSTVIIPTEAKLGRTLKISALSNNIVIGESELLLETPVPITGVFHDFDDNNLYDLDLADKQLYTSTLTDGIV